MQDQDLDEETPALDGAPLIQLHVAHAGVTVQFAAEIVPGGYIVHGDLFLPRSEVSSGSFGPQGFGGPPAARLWPGGRIPIEIHPGLPAALVDSIRAAIEIWEELTPLRFPVHAGEARFVRFVLSSSGADLASPGMLETGPQFIQLRADAPMGNVLHEIGHTVGLFHEHSRPDRGDHIRLIPGNIQSVGSRAYDFIRDPSGTPVSIGVSGPYDFASVMHYPNWMFQVAQGRPTFEIRDAAFPASDVGRWQTLSAGDIALIDSLYGS